jgi:hypothetical protein
MQHLPQHIVFVQSDIRQSLVKASNCAAIHFVVFSVSAVYPHDASLVTKGVGIRGRSTERLGPISSESLDMLGMKAVAECVADYIVGHHPTMPGVRKVLQSLVATGRFEYSAHGSMMTMFRPTSLFQQISQIVWHISTQNLAYANRTPVEAHKL